MVLGRRGIVRLITGLPLKRPRAKADRDADREGGAQMQRKDAKAGNHVPRLLRRGEAIIASTGLAMAAIMLLAMACAGAWTVFHERQVERARVQEDLESWGQLLARSLEQQLGKRNLYSARTLAVNAAVEHGLAQCRVVLPDGQVIADAQAKITVVDRKSTRLNSSKI